MYRSDVPIRIKCAIEVEHAQASDERIISICIYICIYFYIYMYRSDVPIRIKCAIEVEHAQASDERIISICIYICTAVMSPSASSAP